MQTAHRAKVRKSMVRNVEVPVSTASCQKGPVPLNAKAAKTSRIFSSSLSKPMLNTALKLQAKIRHLQKPVEPQSEISKIRNETAVLAKEKITKQMNFPPETKVFRNLVPTNINDSVIMEEHRQQQRRAPQRVVKTDRDPEPDLADFLQPIKPFEVKMDLDYLHVRPGSPNLNIATNELEELYALSEID